MKLLFLSTISRHRWLMAGCLALLAPSFASAQGIQRTLTDKDIERWLPRLRAEAAAFTKQVSEGRELSAAVISASEERQALLEKMVSGETNIEQWMRAHADHMLTPPGAVYCEECSKRLIGERATPIAVLTFNRESPHRDLLRRAASGDEAARDEFHTKRGEEEARERAPAEKAMQDFVAGMISFYRDRGFKYVESIGGSILTTNLRSPDGCVLVSVHEVNPYCGLLPRYIISECAALPTGPLIEVLFEGPVVKLPPQLEQGEEAAAVERAEAAEEPAEGKAVAEKPPAGVKHAAGEKSDADYEAVKLALLAAYNDAANPEALDVEIPSDAPAEVKAELASYAALLAPRKANMLVYKRHEAELAPILKALCQTSEQ